MEKLTLEKKLKYYKIAAGVAGFGFSDMMFEKLVLLYDLTCEKGGETDLRSMSEIIVQVEEKYRLIEEKKVEEKLKENKK